MNAYANLGAFVVANAGAFLMGIFGGESILLRKVFVWVTGAFLCACVAFGVNLGLAILLFLFIPLMIYVESEGKDDCYDTVVNVFLWEIFFLLPAGAWGALAVPIVLVTVGHFLDRWLYWR